LQDRAPQLCSNHTMQKQMINGLSTSLNTYSTTPSQ